MQRFRAIRRTFGSVAVARILLLLFGLIGMGAAGWLWLASPWVAVVAAAGLVLGYVFRRTISRFTIAHFNAVPVGLVVYGILLFAGDRLGISHELKLSFIAATTVAVFNIQYWLLPEEYVRQVLIAERSQ
jgi:hypothetical protein